MKQNNLIKKLTAILTAGTISLAAVGFSGCSEEAELSNFIANLAADGKVNINDCIWVYPETSTNNHYISFIAHNDTHMNTGSKNSFLSYENHKDYRITYKVDSSVYKSVAKIYKEGPVIKFMNFSQISILESIILNHTPIEVKDLNVEANYNHDKFKSNFYFNEEEYLNNL